MSEIRPSLQEIVFLYRENLIGFKEARDGLAFELDWFKEARDPDLDQIEAEVAEAERELAKARGDGEEVGSDKPYPDEE